MKRINWKAIILSVLGVIGSIITIIFFSPKDSWIYDLYLHFVGNNRWIRCDNNFSIERRHFTLMVNHMGSCTIFLKSGEFVVGTADSGFQESIFSGMISDRCAAFLLKGPLQRTFSMDVAGGGDYYFATPYNESYFEDKWKDLDNHETCSQSMRGYDKIECNQSNCWIWP